MGLFQRLFGVFGTHHECAWCGDKATRSARYDTLGLVFPVCGNNGCTEELNRFMSNSGCREAVAGFMSNMKVGSSMGIPREMTTPEFKRRIERLRECVRQQRGA